MNIVFVYMNKDKHISVGVGHIATLVINAGHNLTLFDTAYEPWDELVSDVTSNPYDLVMISASTLFYPHVVELARLVKQSGDVKVLLGGIHATVVGGEILEDCPDIDYICVGEGEDFIIDFLREYESGSKDLYSVPNLGYRDMSGTVKINPIRRCTDLDKLPQLDYRLFPYESVINQYPLPGFCYVFATRGCPYNCSYCCNGYYLSLYKKDFLRTRNIDKVMKELVYLKENYQVGIFYFGDEMILFDEGYVFELFNRIKKELDIPYGCMVRTEKVTPKVVELFKDTNCRYVGMGVECGDEAFRKEFLNRHMTNEQIVSAFQMMRSVEGIKIASFNIVKYPVPYDDELTVKTDQLNGIIKPDIVQKSVFFPFPGTKLYDYCVKRDLIDKEKLGSVRNVFSISVLKDSLYAKQ